jgi:hypothetical protein
MSSIRYCAAPAAFAAAWLALSALVVACAGGPTTPEKPVATFYGETVSIEAERPVALSER